MAASLAVCCACCRQHCYFASRERHWRPYRARRRVRAHQDANPDAGHAASASEVRCLWPAHCSCK